MTSIDDDAGRRFLGRDPHFGPIVRAHGPVSAKPKAKTGFAALASIIVHQQLAGAAAASIHGRFRAALDRRVTAARILETDPEALRGAGLSRAKLAAITDLAVKVEDGTVRFAGLSRRSDDDVVRHLVQVRGIGEWSAHMFLMFHLRRPDVWPVGDLGVRYGWARIHGLDEPLDAKALRDQADHLRPWRSIAAWYCWRAMEIRNE